MLEVYPGALLRLAGDSLDLAELARLLAALGSAPRVSAAARALGLSYRGAWGKLVRAERLLGVALVERVKGHGTRLTAAGSALAHAGARFERNARRRLAGPAAELDAALAALRGEARQPLRLAASHDLLLQAALSEKPDACPSVSFVGSEHALAALDRGEAELAGFHLPEPLPAVRERPGPFRDGALFVEPVMHREQGLIVARGNPLRIRDVADLARTGLRFVNRQRGAGTRAWFDRLLAEQGLQPRQIRGYEQEEYTHFAVAAAVAAGAADAGFGLRAAAAQFGLGFVAVGSELYFLCGARALGEHPDVRVLVRELRRRARAMPGYAPARAGGRTTLTRRAGRPP
ncbi:MAG: helix-turn-helix transcriptional regulator [Burkholderiales bacterium]|nr:helix-turn-helix transcriptional regulator [Burkholderiales bacterium]OJX03808.1 MAG: hypothetical protein BGO72_02390 [Burkholderiales bacterium 70-64]